MCSFELITLDGHADDYVAPVLSHHGYLAQNRRLFGVLVRWVVLRLMTQREQTLELVVSDGRHGEHMA